THAPYEEQQRTDLLRETYQTAVSIPLLRVEEIWKSYDAFETRVDRMGAKQQLSKISPLYMTARTALREMNRFWDTIRATQSNTLPQPPGWTAREVEHLDAWKRYLKWEVSNPLRLGGPDAHKRVIYAYNQACMELWLYPEVWIEFAEYYTTIGQQSDALTKLQTASSVLPESLAVQFAYAETAEKMKQLDVCKQVYEDVVATQRLRMERITEKYTHKLAKLDKRLEKRLEKPSGPDQNQTADQSSSDSDMDDFDDADDNASIGSDSDGGDALAFGEDAKLKRTAQRTARLRKAVEQRKNAINVRMEDELTERREAFTLVWIMYLRYIQRSEGIDAVRQLLKRSRSEPHGYITHHFYVAAALMEYHVGKRPH
ncbi:mRNA 3'-end-processing protein rna14, partial [Coemansia sp. RSA 2131]